MWRNPANKPSGLTYPNDFCRLSPELSSSEASVLAATIASLMLNRNSVASHRKNCSLIYHWDTSDAAHLVDYILYHCDDLTRPLGGTISFNLIHWNLMCKITCYLPLFIWCWIASVSSLKQTNKQSSFLNLANYPLDCIYSDIFSIFSFFSCCSFSYQRRKGERRFIFRLDIVKA